MGSGADPYPELARHVGRAVAERGCHLLTGGGGGVMAEASKAFCEVSPRAGICIGILKGRTGPAPGDSRGALLHTPSLANRWVELPIHTHLPLSGSQGRENESRNHINVLSSDVLVALPGGSGTYAEVTLRIDYGKCLILFLGDYDIDGHRAEHFCSLSRYNNQVLIAQSPEALDSLLNQALNARVPEGSSLTI